MQDEECNLQERTAAVSDPSGIVSPFFNVVIQFAVMNTYFLSGGWPRWPVVVAFLAVQGPWLLHVSSNVSMT